MAAESKLDERRIDNFRELIESRRKANPDEQPLDLKEFQVGLKIGQGAFAQVRRAVHKESKAVIALKTYEKKNLKLDEAQQAVHNEITTLSQMNHPNIMHLHEVIDQRTQVHLVMECCPGMPLFHHLKKLKDKRMGEQQCKEIMR